MTGISSVVKHVNGVEDVKHRYVLILNLCVQIKLFDTILIY